MKKIIALLLVLVLCLSLSISAAANVISPSGGNDGGSMQRARGGMPVVVLSVPCRYIHSPSSVIKYSDVDDQFELTKALLRSL